MLYISIREKSPGRTTHSQLHYTLIIHTQAAYRHTMTDTYSLDTPYMSIYDRPKKKSGRPKIYTDEELKQRSNARSLKYKADNYEYLLLKDRIQNQLRYQEKKKTSNSFNDLFVLLCLKMLESISF